MDTHFDLLRADEELIRLDIEITRFVTYMQDEDLFLWWKEDVIRDSGNEELAHHMRQYRNERGRFTAVHLDRLVKLSKVPGFTGSLTPGISVSKERRVPEAWLAAHDIPMPMSIEAQEGDDEGEEDEDALVELFANIILVSHDPGDVGGEAPRRSLVVCLVSCICTTFPLYSTPIYPTPPTN
jgi:hypothetical protein